MSPIPVILLKESSRSCSANTPDPYAYLLSRPSSGSSKPSYAPYYVPVFETGFSNETELDSLLSQGGDKWRGVIISSQRAVEAWKSSALRVGKAWESDEALQNQGKGKGKGKERVGESDDLAWSSTPFFTVGPSTAQALLDLASTISEDLSPSPRLVIGGESAGNTPALAKVISTYFSGSPSEPARVSLDSTDGRPLLYLTGDKNSSALATLLSQQTPPISVHPFDVYQTSPSPTFSTRFASLLDQLFPSLPAPSLPKHWVVVFSPSTIPLILPGLESKRLLEHIRFAAIGPTTRDAMVDEPDLMLNEKDLTMSAKPTAGDLVSALRSKDGLV